MNPGLKAGVFFCLAMNKQYLLSATFGALLGSACVLAAHQVIYHKDLGTSEIALGLKDEGGALMEERINSIHQRISDFYLFEGIVITLLLTINVGIFLRAKQEIETHFSENLDSYKIRLQEIQDECERIADEIKGGFRVTSKDES